MTTTPEPSLRTGLGRLAGVFELGLAAPVCLIWELAYSCRGGAMAAKFFTGLPLDGPDPECVQGYGAEALKADPEQAPRPALEHSRGGRGGGQAAVGDQPGGQRPAPVKFRARIPRALGVTGSPRPYSQPRPPTMTRSAQTTRRATARQRPRPASHPQPAPKFSGQRDCAARRLNEPTRV
jgi:hypothetical protein